MRILLAYGLSTGEKLWIITEWHRWVTTLLLPEEYWVEVGCTPQVVREHRDDPELFGPIEAEVIRMPIGFGALLRDGPHAGRWWALDGEWAVGERLSVLY